MPVPFNRPSLAGAELAYVAEAVANRHLSGNGPFTKRCQEWLERRTGCGKALLTHSGTGALEMAAMLCDLEPGDEVVMPSFTFVSTANAFVLRGATPVFVDVRADTLNLDERLVEQAITARTRAIVPVHYAGVACEMDAVIAIADAHRLWVIEDAAQAVMSTYSDRPLGTFGAAAALSFHETKNVISGEGGALLVNEQTWRERAEVIWEKGTNRAAFFRGQVDKYSWVDIGSSFLPSEVTAAFLWAQLERADSRSADRLASWQAYHSAFAPLEAAGLLRRPVVPARVCHNAHLYYLLLPTASTLDETLAVLRSAGIDAVRHYVPLHGSSAGRRFGRASAALPVTEDVSARLLRLPLWAGMSSTDVGSVVDAVWAAVSAERPSISDHAPSA